MAATRKKKAGRKTSKKVQSSPASALPSAPESFFPDLQKEIEETFSRMFKGFADLWSPWKWPEFDPLGKTEFSMHMRNPLGRLSVDFTEGDPTLPRIYLHIAVTGAMTDDIIRQRVLHHHAERVKRFGEAIQREHPSLSDTDAASEAENLLATLHGLALRKAMEPDFSIAVLARETEHAIGERAAT